MLSFIFFGIAFGITYDVFILQGDSFESLVPTFNYYRHISYHNNETKVVTKTKITPTTFLVDKKIYDQ